MARCVRAARAGAREAATSQAYLTDLWVIIIGAALLGSYIAGLALH